MKYDLTLKALFQQVPQQLFNILIGQQPQEIRRDALEKLHILANLHSVELRQTLKQEVENMPITVDTRETIWYQDGFLEGEHKGRLEREHKGRLEGKLEGESLILQRQLTRRFGNLPGWATQKIAQAQEEQLELWSLRILEVDNWKTFLHPLYNNFDPVQL